MKRKIKKIWNKHWNIIPWLITGGLPLLREQISHSSYACAWIAVLIMIWCFAPLKNKEETKDSA